MCVCIHFINTILFALSLSQLGGTIGDIEGMPFVEAFRQFQFRCGLTNFANIHVSLVPQVIGVTFYVHIFNHRHKYRRVCRCVCRYNHYLQLGTVLPLMCDGTCGYFVIVVSSVLLIA